MKTKCLTTHSAAGVLRTTMLAATVAVAIFGFAPGLRAQLAPAPFQNNDVLISAEASQVFVFTMNGASRTTGGAPLVYSPALSPRTGGMAFDRAAAPNLLVGLPDATATGDTGTVGKFDANGNATAPFGSGYGGFPFSMALNSSGNVLVGEEGPDLTTGDERDLLKFSSAGMLLNRYAAQVEGRGVKWLDVKCDQSTVLYTSESRAIKAFNSNNGTQIMPDFVADTSTATVPDTGTPYTGPLEALKVIPNGYPPSASVQPGQVIVATRDPAQGLLRFSADGSTIVRNYVRSLPNTPGVFVGVTLDPTQASVWTVDIANREAVEFDVESGVEMSSFPLPAGLVSAEAITIKGERLCGNPAPPVSMCGRMYGGGSFPISNGTKAYHGFTLSNVNNPPNRMTVCWKDSSGNNKSFKLTQLTSALLYDDPTFTPNPPRSGFDSYMGTGTGTINGVAGATATWTFTDKGEPGTNDTVNMQIKDASGLVVMTTVGTVKQNSPCGNHRACPCP